MSTLAVPQTATSTWNLDPVHSAAEFKVTLDVQFVKA